MDKFLKQLGVVEQTMKSHLQTIIPNIRKDGCKEDKLENLLLQYQQSPFESKNADTFLDR